ncbi:MAG: hypothetical protein M3453_10105 [Pseudomonadota bacterium]|nr:hypothetical protein [Pseudomonadota bacterium]
MADYVTRNEFELLATRVDVLESEVEGEKMVTRHILEQTRRNGDDLAALKTRFDRQERRLDALERKVDVLDGKVDGLIKNLPNMIADVMREVLRERDGQS